MALIIAGPMLLLVAGTLIILGLRHQADSGTLPLQGGGVTAPASTGPPDQTPGGQSQDSGAETALRACRAKVHAADKVLAAGKDGMGHWSDHIQAQTDANAGKITIKEMDDIFHRTMMAGNEDEKRYDKAVKTHEETSGSCKDLPGASTGIAQQLQRCAEREHRQEPVLAAAKDGMADWTKHLAEMRRSKQGKIHNPQKQWLRTWRAAPPHIEAYKKAADRFNAPDC